MIRLKTRCLEYVQFQGVGTLSAIIQKHSRDKDSHSAVIDREAKDGKILIEQWPHKGGLKSWCDYNYFSPEGGHTEGTPYQIWSLEVPTDDYEWIMEQYRESARVKKKYDWGGIMDFGFKGDGDPDKTFCSEEMVMHYRQCQIDNGNDSLKFVRPEVVHPGYWRNLLIFAGAVPTIGGVI